MYMALRVTCFFSTRSGFSTVGHRKGLTSSPLLVYIGNHCGVVYGYRHYLGQAEVRTLLGPERPPLVPDNLCVTSFLKETSFPL